MSTKSKRGFAAAAADTGGATPPAASPTPTITYYQQLADDAVKAIDALAAAMPPLEASHPSTADFVRSHRNVPPSSLAETVAIVEQNPELVATNKMPPPESRNDLQFAEAFGPVGQKLIAVGETVVFTVNAKLAALTASGQQIRAVTEALSRDPGSAHLIPVAGRLKKLYGKKRGSRKKTAPAPPAIPKAA
ncbi:MAG TPA: hypothetical protein VH087_17990 [Thermoanaerobaculia bacterium]|jgi:hypothetical protein|nr:hypothetical protein [Thermoanaerobaculia bacterium]